jgi:hypothetical protein
MNGFKKYIYTFLYSLIFFSGSNIRCEDQAIINPEMKTSEVDFLLGYQDFLNNRYDLAADKFYSVVLDQPSNNILNRSYLYLSLSQFKLGNVTDSSYNASFVDKRKLDSKDKLLFQRLVHSLGNLYSRALIQRKDVELIKKRRSYFILPYLGRISYSDLPEKKSALFYGLALATQKEQWTFSLGAEFFELQSHISTSSYQQTQYNSGLDFLTLNQSLIYGRFSRIISPLKTQSNITMYGIGFEKNISKNVRGIVDFYRSLYPNFVQGEMTVNQIDLAAKYNFFESKTSLIEIQPGLQFTTPTINTENSDFFIESQSYQKYSFDVYIHREKMTINLQYWLGDEVFGVRNQGRIIFSGVEKHQGGYSLGIASELMDNLRGQLTLMNEKILMNTDSGNSNTIMVMLQFIAF